MKYIKGMLLDTKKGTTEVVNLEKENDTSFCEKIYELLDCEHFDILRLKIGTTEVDCYCDDDFLYTKTTEPSGIINGELRLFGNLLFLDCDFANGESISLKPEQILQIGKNARFYTLQNLETMENERHLLVECEYV
jgi:hypothetical protein